MGSGLNGSLFGDPPDLEVEKNRDLEFSTDFRSVYSTIIDKWFDADATAVLGRKHPQIDFI